MIFYHVISFLSTSLSVYKGWLFSFQYFVINFTILIKEGMYFDFRRDHESSDFWKTAINKWLWNYFLNLQFDNLVQFLKWEEKKRYLWYARYIYDQAKFMNKNLVKAIINCSMLSNRYRYEKQKQLSLHIGETAIFVWSN